MPIKKDAVTLNLPPEFIRKFYLEPLNTLSTVLYSTKDTAVLIFSRTAKEEAAAKKYGSSRRGNIRVAGQLIAHTLRAAISSGLPVIRKYSGNQHGVSFGERLANAIEEVYAQGYARVIAIGTDTPGISPAIIRAISVGLRSHAIITGPSADGGVYAIGLARKSWNRAAFLEISWETDIVQKELAEYGTSSGPAHQLLPVLGDIDCGTDFAVWMNNTGWHHALVRFIHTVLNTLRQLGYTVCSIQLCLCDMQVARRGPPVAALA